MYICDIFLQNNTNNTMRKIIFTCVMIVLGFSFTNAKQNFDEFDSDGVTEFGNDDEQSIFLGFTFGYNQSNYSGDRNPKWGSGGQVGINCEIRAGDVFSIQPELIFSYKTVGIDYLVPTNSTNINANVDYGIEDMENVFFVNSSDRMWYMSFPINLKIAIPLGSVRPFLSAAPMLDLGLYGKNKVDNYNKLQLTLQELGLFNEKNDKIKDYDLLLFQANPNDKAFYFREKPIYNNVNFSLLFKVGLDFGFGLTLSAAYQMGLTNMYKLTPSAEKLYNTLGMKTEQKIQTFSFSLGFNF